MMTFACVNTHPHSLRVDSALFTDDKERELPGWPGFLTAPCSLGSRAPPRRKAGRTGVYSGSNPLAGRCGGWCSHTSKLMPAPYSHPNPCSLIPTTVLIENPPPSTPASQDQDPAVSSPWSSLCPDINSITTKTCLPVQVDLSYSAESMHFISI